MSATPSIASGDQGNVLFGAHRRRSNTSRRRSTVPRAYLEPYPEARRAISFLALGKRVEDLDGFCGTPYWLAKGSAPAWWRDPSVPRKEFDAPLLRLTRQELEYAQQSLPDAELCEVGEVTEINHSYRRVVRLPDEEMVWTVSPIELEIARNIVEEAGHDLHHFRLISHPSPHRRDRTLAGCDPHESLLLIVSAIAEHGRA